MYRLRDANVHDKELLINYKLSTILEYAKDLSKDEAQRIYDYVKTSVSELLSAYKIVEVDGVCVGSFLVIEYEDGAMLDEIYIDYDYRNKGMGTDIIKNVLGKHSVVYLWVYKNNERARKLYQELGFVLEKETETRYFMKHVSN